MVYKPKYQWRNVTFPVKADVAAKELNRIQDKYGEVTPSNLLEESRAETAVMHDCYEWDDSKAAEKWRLQQSRQIMSCLTVVYEQVDSDQETVKSIEVRAFQNTSEEREGRFLHVQDVMETPEYREIVLRKAFGELAAFRRKYSDLSELSKIISAIDSVMSSVM